MGEGWSYICEGLYLILNYWRKSKQVNCYFFHFLSHKFPITPMWHAEVPGLNTISVKRNVKILPQDYWSQTEEQEDWGRCPKEVFTEKGQACVFWGLLEECFWNCKQAAMSTHAPSSSSFPTVQPSIKCSTAETGGAKCKALPSSFCEHLLWCSVSPWLSQMPLCRQETLFT